MLCGGTIYVPETGNQRQTEATHTRSFELRSGCVLPFFPGLSYAKTNMSKFHELNMIYPEKSVEDWCSRYPAIQVASCTCIDCGGLIISSRPYLARDYAGLESPPCACGSTRSSCSSSVPLGKFERAAWDTQMNFYL